MRRNLFLKNVPIGEALDRWLALCVEGGAGFPLETVSVPTGESAGMVTAEPQFARLSSPPFHSAAMDGIAVRAEHSYGASENNPVIFTLGENSEWIDTGEPLPDRYNAVIMVEELDEMREGVFEVIRPAFPWQHVRPLGEDIVQSELILPRGHLIRAVDIGALINGGITEVPVRRRPVIAIVPTGTELVEDPRLVAPGKVMESNSWTLSAFIRDCGAEVRRHELLVDDYQLIRDAIKAELASVDAVVINAGTSAGREDFTRAIVEELGTVAVHGVAMRPGKPVVLGVIGDKPVIGLPGFPTANFRGAQEFLVPLIARFSGLPSERGRYVKARLARKLFSVPGFDEFVQVKLGRVEEEVVAVPLHRGSGVSMSLVRSDGTVKVPAACEGIGRWATVDVLLYSDEVNIDGTILAIGSHDISLDLLSSRIREENPRLHLASANVGSMAGVMAIRDRQAHIAGTHLLDTATGRYNVSFVRKIMGAEGASLIILAFRMQGLLVRRGNPKGITGVEDLADERLTYINRQKGAGTRILFDFELERHGIMPSDVPGYEREVFTHTAVAAAVAGGTADVGMGVLAAAQALDLEFIPVARERYDLLVLESFTSTTAYYTLIDILNDPEYRGEVESLGGYDLSSAGTEVSLTDTVVADDD